jgi:hypothetical protein
MEGVYNILAFNMTLLFAPIDIHTFYKVIKHISGDFQ